MNNDQCSIMTTSTKQKLVDTAIEMFWLQSYSCVSVEDICRSAGVKKGSFYHFFPSKTDLVLTAFEVLWGRFSVALDEAFSVALPPEVRVCNYAELVYQVQKEKFELTGKVLGCPYASCGGEMGTQDERIRQKVLELIEYYSRYFSMLLKDAHCTDDPSRVAMQMLSYSVGVTFQAKIRNDLEVIREHLGPGLLRFIR